MKNIKGFSLVELMVVVAIIGILAAVAIPNFQRFQRKARQSEAKSLLGGLFTAEKAFYAEWQDYTTDFVHMGYSPDGQLRYDAGFETADNIATLNINGYSQVVAIAETTDVRTAVFCGAANTNCAYVTNPAVPLGTGTAVSAISGPNTAGAADAFTAAAIAPIGGASNDVWLIDEQKLLRNATDGTVD